MPRVLVLALENWLGAARMPKALRGAGFEVSLLSYPNALISLTKYANDRDLIQPSDDAHAVARRIMALLEGRPARMIIAVDDRAQRYLQHIVEVTSTGYLPPELTDLVARSLPPQESFAYGCDKDAATELMAGLGARTPKRTVVRSIDEIQALAESEGLPLILKPLQGTAGQGIQILSSASEVGTASLAGSPRWMVQRYIVGKAASCASVAVGGRLLGAIAIEKTITHPADTGPACVVTRLDRDDILENARLFAEAAQFTGFFSLGYVVEESTGDANFIECNARAVPVVPSSAKIGLDLSKALFAGLTGGPLPTLDRDAPHIMALYPQELHRDPNSENRNLVLDEPTDDPLLHQAMQKGIELLASGRF